MPQLRDEVAVVGYPVGGEEISITEGVVSRIEVQRYSHSQRHLLAVTVDAAINAGNSGGPVFGNGKVVGIAFQKLTGVDNIGEMVPPPIIRAFLDGVDAGQAPEIPALGITTQNLENPLLRRQLGLADDERGVVVLHVDYGGSADGILAAARRDHRDRRPADREQRHRPATWATTAPATTSCSGTATSAIRSSSRSSATASAQTVADRAQAVDAAGAALALRPAAAVLRLRRPRVPDPDPRLPDDVGQVVEQGAEGVPQLLLPRLPHARSSTRS